MSKSKDNKGFKAGLEQLWMDAMQEEDNAQPISPVPKSKPKPAPKAKKKTAKRTRSTTSKSFTDDLSSLFNDSIMESVQERVKQIKEQPKPTKKSTSARKQKARADKPTGLDILIRRTVESSKVNISSEPKRRITFLFEEEKITRLKSIANARQAYIKDIIGDIVSEFINDYEKKEQKD